MLKPPPEPMTYLTPMEFAWVNHAIVRALPFDQFALRWLALTPASTWRDPNHFRHTLY